jgi:hypothetical protein
MSGERGGFSERKGNKLLVFLTILAAVGALYLIGRLFFYFLDMVRLWHGKIS